MKKSTNILIIILLSMVAILIMVVSVFVFTRVPDDGDVVKDIKEISNIEIETGKTIYKTEEEIEAEKEVEEILAEELIMYSEIEDDSTRLILNNKDGELIAGNIKDDLYNEIDYNLHRGDFLYASKVMSNALEKYSIDDSCNDIISYAEDITYVVPLNTMEVIHAQDRLGIIKDDKVYTIALLFSRPDIQVTLLPEESLVINYFDEALFVKELDATPEDTIFFGQLHYNVSVKKYLLKVDEEDIYAFVLNDKNGTRKFGGFYYASENPKVPFSTKKNWE